MNRTSRHSGSAPRSLRIFVCLLLVAAFTPAVGAQAIVPPTGDTYYVDVATGSDSNAGGMNDPFKSISEATYNVASGDTIMVAPGTYTSSETTSSGEEFPIWVPPGVTLKSSGGTDVTIVDAEHDSTVFVLVPGGSTQEAQTVPMPLIPPVQSEYEGPVTFEGFTITGGFTERTGGGIYALGSELNLRDMVVTDCAAAIAGGGLHAVASTVTIESSSFVSNGYDPYFEADLGQATAGEDDQRWLGAYTLSGGGAFFWLSSVDIKTSEFLSNGTLVRGAGVTSRRSMMKVADSDFDANVITAEIDSLRGSNEDGYAEGYGGLSTQVEILNLGGFDGGAINSIQGSQLSVERCTFDYNAAPWGGGVFFDDSSAGKISRSEFTGNYCLGGAAIAQMNDSADRQEAAELEALKEFDDVTPDGTLALPGQSGFSVDQCVFEDHEAEEFATVLTSWETSATIQNSLFDNNMTPLTQVSFGIARFASSNQASTITDELPGPTFPTKTVMNCTFADNGSLNSVLADVPEAKVVNTISWGNEDMYDLMPPIEPPPGLPQETNGAYPWEYSVWGAEVFNCDLEYDYMMLYADTDEWGNISEDPLFLMPSARDYRLSPPSPCTDTATSTAAPTYDLPGTTRPQDGDNDGTAAWDMGAFEAVYSGTVRTAGGTRYGTSVNITQEYFDSSDVVVLARGDLFADGLASAGLCGVYEAPLLLTTPDALPWEVKAEIERLGASMVYIMGGTGAVSDGVKSELEDMGLAVERIGGYDRYATAAMIAEKIESEIGTPTATFIARGDLFADALTVSPVAYGIKSPILLVRTGALPPATVDVLEDLNPGTVVIAGGAGAVSLNVEKGVEALTSPADRIAGSDRYDTAVAFSEYAIAQDWAKWMTTGLATGANFPDALTGGPAIGTDHGLLLLTPGENLYPGVESALSDNKAFISRLDIFGGTGAISDSVMAAAKAAIE